MMMELQMSVKQQLLAKITEHTARVSVIGLGYVGLPLAVAFAEAGFRVTGIDVDGDKVAAINAGQSYIGDIGSARLGALVPEKLSATVDYAVLVESDIAIICVPTPLSKTKDPDISYIIAAADEIGRHAHKGMLIVLESTTYPGTTEEVIVPRMVADGLRVGQDVFVAFSPERIDPGRRDYTVETTPKVVGGVTANCCDLAEAFYTQAIRRVIRVRSTQAAEMVKLLENTFRAVNIALVNEMAIMCDKLGLDIWEIVDAAATKPYGFMKFTPGPGVGGHCIPLDPHYLSWKLKTLNYNARFIQLAGEINTAMPAYWVDKVGQALNEVGKPLKGSYVLILGVSYKKDVGDVRESPALDILELLRKSKVDVHYHDPHVLQIRYDEGYLTTEPDLDQALAQADCVIIVTDHSAYDYGHIKQAAALIVDTRHAIEGQKR